MRLDTLVKIGKTPEMKSSGGSKKKIKRQKKEKE